MRTIVKATLSIFTIFLLVTSIGATEDLGARIEERLRRSHRNTNFHGTLIVKKGNELLFKKAGGLANREWNVPHTMQSKFMLASLTKQFTAYAILNLNHEGKLNLNDSISDYINLPQNSRVDVDQWKAITLRHLLTHTAGLVRDIKRTENMSRSDYNLLGTIVSHVLQGPKVIVKSPGKYSYSNLGYLLLAQVIEKVSKSFYGSYLKRVIFNPLKMYNTGEYHRRKMIPFMVDGYYYGEMRKVAKRCCDDASIFTGSHNLYSDAEDMLIWMQELHGKTNILNRDVLTKMKTSQVSQMDSDDESSTYGHGLVIDQWQGQSRIWHTGHEWGYSTMLAFLPELDLTVIYLTNVHGQDIFSYTPNNTRFLNMLLEDLAL